MTFHWAQFPIDSDKLQRWKALDRENIGKPQYDCAVNVLSFFEKIDREPAVQLAVQVSKKKGMDEKEIEKLLFEKDNITYKFEEIYYYKKNSLRNLLNEINEKIENNHGIVVNIYYETQKSQIIDEERIKRRRLESNNLGHCLIFLKLNGNLGIFDPQDESIILKNIHYNFNKGQCDMTQIPEDFFIFDNDKIMNELLKYRIKFICVCVASNKRKRERINVRKDKEEHTSRKKIRGSGKKKIIKRENKNNKTKKTKI